MDRAVFRGDLGRDDSNHRHRDFVFIGFVMWLMVDVFLSRLASWRTRPDQRRIRRIRFLEVAMCLWINNQLVSRLKRSTVSGHIHRFGIVATTKHARPRNTLLSTVGEYDIARYFELLSRRNCSDTDVANIPINVHLGASR